MARARAPSVRLMLARGLAPKVMKRRRSFSPCFSGVRVADTSFTAYWISEGSTYTRRASACSAASCSVVATAETSTGGPITRCTITNSSSSVG